MRKKNLIKGMLTVGCLTLAMLAVKTTDVKADTYTYIVGTNHNDGTISYGEATVSGNIIKSGDYLLIMDGTKITEYKDVDESKPGTGELVIPEGVTEIGDNGLMGVSAQTIKFPSTLTKIGNYSLACPNLKEVTIPKTIKSVSYAAFDMCDSLETVTIESGVTFIDQLAFADCKSLTKVYIPSSVTTISWGIAYKNAFNNSKNVVIYAPKDSYAYNYAKNILGLKVVDTAVKTPSNLSKLKASKNTATSVKLTWSSSNNSTEYRVYQYLNKKWTKIGVTSSTSYTISSLKSASSIKFKVIPVNVKTNGTKSGKSAVITTYTKNVTPVISTVVKKSTTSVKISLVKDKTAKYYEIYTSKNGKSYSKAITIKNSSSGISSYILKTGLKKSGTNYIKVRAYSTINGKKVYSSYSNIIKVSLNNIKDGAWSAVLLIEHVKSEVE